MPSYNLKRNVKLYVVRSGLKYKIDIFPDVSFSQTFDEQALRVKTLHAQNNMFEDATITKANPANFNFTIPALAEDDLKILYQLLIDYDITSSEVTLNTFDIYVEGDTDVWKIQTCVLERGLFK